MKTIKITGHERIEGGKKRSRELHKQALLPGVLYGGKRHIQFYLSMAEVNQLVYTPQAHFIDFHLGSNRYRCILQEVQMHPVSEMLMHVDFLEIFDDKPVVMEIPITCQGKAAGVSQGGLLVQKLRKIKVNALPGNMPAEVIMDVTGLELGKTSRVSDIVTGSYTLLHIPGAPVAMVEVPRALRSKAAGETPGKTAEASKPAKGAKQGK